MNKFDDLTNDEIATLQGYVPWAEMNPKDTITFLEGIHVGYVDDKIYRGLENKGYISEFDGVLFYITSKGIEYIILITPLKRL